jgi:phosphatidylglycerol:prolipoprotein diacylglycerol transferase
MSSAVITIGISPDIHLGPVKLAWHGVTIALGIAAGYFASARWVRARGLAVEPLQTLTGMLAVAGIVGGRLFYLAEHGGPLLGTRGFTFDGGLILAGLVLAVYVRRTRLDVLYLDAIALWLPLGVAIGRIGDLINGEHYGAVSRSFLAVRNSNPHALTPNSALAYQNGGLYEVLLALAVLALMLSVQRLVRRPGDLAWLVVVLFAVGRFAEFFLRSDSPELALGLSNAQWTSLALVAAAAAGRTVAVRRSGPIRPVPSGHG